MRRQALGGKKPELWLVRVVAVVRSKVCFGNCVVWCHDSTVTCMMAHACNKARNKGNHTRRPCSFCVSLRMPCRFIYKLCAKTHKTHVLSWMHPFKLVSCATLDASCNVGCLLYNSVMSCVQRWMHPLQLCYVVCATGTLALLKNSYTGDLTLPLSSKEVSLN
jgi:hypothetical protein